MPTRAVHLTPNHRAIGAYYRALAAFRHQDVVHEQAVRSAFQSLLADTASALQWTAIPELGSKSRGKRVVPDGTLWDRYRLPRGFWEAKDSADDLDAEIVLKIEKGYPTSNTIFWTPDRAVLFQDSHRLPYDERITDDEEGRHALCGILNAFFSHVDKPFQDFEQAVEAFNQRVPELGARLAEIIATAHKTHRPFKDAFATFFALCRTTLNPQIVEAAVDEMLVQHLLTYRLFKTIFKSPEFVRKNVIAAEVEKVIDALASTSFTRDDFLANLDLFYVAIENAAESIIDFSDKQHFLNAVYEKFFKGYCVKTADTHGIIYTPQPIVDFMCDSIEYVLREEFGKELGDDGVILLDPCTGTGNFVINLMRRAADRGKRHLQRMYREQLFANEIMLLPYYVSAMNIEHEFYDHTGEYEAFDGLCFVDTLELAEDKQAGLFAEKNARRVERQRSAPITVVIGNPPYNVGQMLHNERNKNRKYPVIDAAVKKTYSKDSTASSVSKLNDPYVKFFRWATDRLGGRDGIVCFVSNNSFVANCAFDGMRKHLARDFQSIYHLDLEGNVRQDPKLSGTQYNVFGIQLGVGITIAVKRPAVATGSIRYATVGKALRRYEKLNWLTSHSSVANVDWSVLVPDARNTWLVPPNAQEFESFIPIADKASRATEVGAPNVMFQDYTLGMDTHRDQVVYDFSREALASRIRAFIDDYNVEVDRWKRAPVGANIDDHVRYDKIQWNPDLKNAVRRGKHVEFSDTSLRLCQYRPFARRMLYFDRTLNARVFGWPRLAPKPDTSNRIIAVTAIGSEKPFMCLMTPSLADLHLVGAGAQCQCFPLWTYDAAGSTRTENVSQSALASFRSHYNEGGLTAWDVFHYVYALLHHPGYRTRYAENLRCDLPRIPFAPEFAAFARTGERLAELHLAYDDPSVVAPYPLIEDWKSGRPRSYRVQKMKLSKDRTSLVVNESLVLREIPLGAFDYLLGGRSALEWVIEQYEVYEDARLSITADPNAWCFEHSDEEYIVRLVKQVITVSLETQKLISALPTAFGSQAARSSARRAGPGKGRVTR